MSNLNAGAGHRERFQPQATRDRWGTLSNGAWRRIPSSKFVPLSGAAQAREDAAWGAMLRERDEILKAEGQRYRLLGIGVVAFGVWVLMDTLPVVWDFLRAVWRGIP
jgi:hypothetical protein